MTADLFATTPQPAPKPSKKGDVPRRKAVFKEVDVPHGQPDKKGLYWYQRFNNDVEKMTPRGRELLLELILDTSPAIVDDIRKRLTKWCSDKTEPLDRDNFSEAKGR